MTVVLDASAVLAFLQGEHGSDLVEEALAERVVCGAANWSEVAQKVMAAGRNWELVRALLVSYGVAIEVVTGDDAELAAERWEPSSGFSLADRLCLALGERLDADVLTADARWGTAGRVRQIR